MLICHYSLKKSSVTAFQATEAKSVNQSNLGKNGVIDPSGQNFEKKWAGLPLSGQNR
jgi:hypothetical protein